MALLIEQLEAMTVRTKPLYEGRLLYQTELNGAPASCLPVGWWTSSDAGHGGRSLRSEHHRCRSSPEALPGGTELRPESFSQHRSDPQYQPGDTGDTHTHTHTHTHFPYCTLCKLTSRLWLCADQHLSPSRGVGRWRWCLWAPAVHRHRRRSSPG